MKNKSTEKNNSDPAGILFHARAIDRTGWRYGRLVCIEPTEERKSGSIIWRCRCDCGNEKLISARILENGTVKSCGCLRKEKMASRATDHRGKRYGKLVAIEPIRDRQGGGVLWRCQCDCGKECFVRASYLKSGAKTSCGTCLPWLKQR